MTMPDTAALDACVTGATQQVIVRAALYLGETELTAVSLGGGSVKADARRTQTRDASLELLPDGTHDTDDLYRLVSVPGTTVKLWRGFVLADASELLVPLGVFVVESAEWKEQASGSSLSVSCADLSVRIARAVWADPMQIAAGTNLAAAITSILQDRWPLVTTNMPEALYSETLGAKATLGTSTSGDPWADACALAEAHGYILMFDADGVAVLRTQPTAATVPVFSFAPGATALMTERDRETKLTDTYNGVIATGEGPEIATPIRAEAWDEDPTSPTYRYGLFGQVPYLYSSSLLTTQAKAQAAADARLAQLLGRSTSLSWSQIVHPGLAPLDVVEVETTETKRYILDAIDMPLSIGGTMTATARELRT